MSVNGTVQFLIKRNLRDKIKEGASKGIQESPWRLHWGIFWKFDFIICLTLTLSSPIKGEAKRARVWFYRKQPN
ncbi:MAG: hypothetical protein COZ69_11805 [Deltaproteobacteria bacterium CG_4_8_14_3_um_filter_45_9]|nr:MAG: hypothetical protein COS40_09600 [Deltaproteobacteria bacterium CG03_land_8_20_14_0_80_45_14]PIX22144.1 MAG: hypothetical protein COZ69_11805 [Deltaproteobacteria bacterium CG_4_8_14_3_um_filter_45_9]